MLESDLPQHVPELVKQNIVATVDLGCKLDLKKIALSARNAEYNPKRFQAVIMRKREPKTTALIFSTGKMVVTGAKSEAESKSAAGKFAKVVNKIEAEAGCKNFKIQNIVVSCNVNFAIRLETLEVFCNSKVPTSCSYCPEIFPGLIYRLRDPKVVMLIFASGKVVITGAKNFDKETKPAWDKMYPLIQQHRSKRTATMVISSSAQNKNRVRQSEQGNLSVIS